MGPKLPWADPGSPLCRRCFLHGLFRGQCPYRASCRSYTLQYWNSAPNLKIQSFQNRAAGGRKHHYPGRAYPAGLYGLVPTENRAVYCSSSDLPSRAGSVLSPICRTLPAGSFCCCWPLPISPPTGVLLNLSSRALWTDWRQEFHSSTS